MRVWVYETQSRSAVQTQGGGEVRQYVCVFPGVHVWAKKKVFVKGFRARVANEQEHIECL